MDHDEVVMLIRAVLASKKHAITIKELEDEYYECNFTRIPFKQMGFDNLVKLLESEPSKLSLIKDPLNGYMVRAVIDSEISALSRLVAGQKSTKKKKKSKSKPKPNMYQMRGSFGMRKPTGKNNTVNPKQRPGYSNGPSNNNQNYNNQKMGSRNVTQMNSMKDRFKNDRDYISCGSSENLPIMNKLPTTKFFESTDLSSLWIENAAYFLRECEIIVTYIEDFDRVFIRLIGEGFSNEFDRMAKRLNEIYKFNIVSFKNPEIAPNKICIVYENQTNSFYRAQISRVNGNDVECLLVDSGKTNVYKRADIFIADKEFLKLKFQAVRVQITGFDHLYRNDYVKRMLEEKFIGKRFIAHRVQSDPLKVKLNNMKNVPIDEQFLKVFEHLFTFKPEPCSIHTAFITYVDEETSLAYLQSSNNQKFNETMIEINQYLEKNSNTVNLNEIVRVMNDDQYIRTHLFCAKYSIDNVWYRVKVLRPLASRKVQICFIDFGNREVVDLESLRMIPDHFTLFKNFPPQAYPVSFLSESVKIDYLKELWYDSNNIQVKIVRVNNQGIPSVELVNVLSPSTRQDIIEIESVATIQSSSVSPSSSSSYSVVNNYNLERESQNIIEGISNLTISENPNELKDMMYKDIHENNLSPNSLISASYVSSPFDFVINLESSRGEYENLLREMRQFYLNRSQDYQVENPLKEHVYVSRDDNSNCSRVKFLNFITGDFASVYHIDVGNYDAVPSKSLFYLTKRFSKLKRQAIKVQLTDVNYDKLDSWSDTCKAYFNRLLKDKKTFKVTIKRFDLENDSFKIDLFDEDGSVSQRLIKSGLAKA